MGSPVPLSNEAVGVITRLRNMKVGSALIHVRRYLKMLVLQDEDEDWSRWRDVVFRAKGALTPRGLEIKPPPPQNVRKRGKAEFVKEEWNLRKAPVMIKAEQGNATFIGGLADGIALDGPSTVSAASGLPPATQPGPDPLLLSTEDSAQASQLSVNEVLGKVSTMELQTGPTAVVESENLYCPECYLPLHPDPKPERLYIFLHALKYTTSLGSFETGMPEWAAEGWTWDRS